jgi:hypothetical protein
VHGDNHDLGRHLSTRYSVYIDVGVGLAISKALQPPLVLRTPGSARGAGEARGFATSPSRLALARRTWCREDWK